MNTLDPKAARIVLLDDDEFMLRLLFRMLAQLGYSQLFACESGEQALQHIVAPEASVDLIFLDINMPGMDGVEFIRRLAHARYSGSVMLVSGEDSRSLASIEKLIEAQQLTSLGYLQKPVKPQELAARMEHFKPKSTRGAPSRKGGKAYGAEELRAAIRNGELVNYYQPKVALPTSKVVGVECLVRWQHPVDGLIFPDRFIPLATEHGLLSEVTRVVLASALKQAKSWRQAGHHLSVAVNVSMDDLSALDFPDVAAGLAHAVGVEPNLITLEVTESQVMGQLNTVLDVLSRLRLKRFRLAIDDFGTGHSSLAQLRDLPFDELKIDRGFVHGASADATRGAICSASVRMAQQLNLQVVGEGIEDREDLDFLCQLGCDVGQGYFIARPMPATDVAAWVGEWQARQRVANALKA